jgi:hypothetical protein
MIARVVALSEDICSLLDYKLEFCCYLSDMCLEDFNGYVGFHHIIQSGFLVSLLLGMKDRFFGLMKGWFEKRLV